MRGMTMKAILASGVISFPLFLGACSSTPPAPPSAGARMLERGGQIAEHGKAWESGNQDVLRGRDLIAKNEKQLSAGEKELARAQKAVRRAEEKIAKSTAGKAKGERLVASGTVEMQQAEASYVALRATTPAVSPVQR